ncbi:MAG: hypothetical protein D6E12_00825 [Desulfovibrio sp.]|nr:MAG: hypothetical protein D6E12_00825 [Desulfovibrio sp.]
MDNGRRVVGVDISLDSMSNFLEEQRLLPGSEAFLFQANGDVTAQVVEEIGGGTAEDSPTVELTVEELEFLAEHPVIRASNELDWPPFDFALSGNPRGYSVDLLDMLAARVGLKVQYVNGYDWNGLVELFEQGDLDLLHSLFRTSEREELGIFTPAYLPMPQVFATRSGSMPAPTLESLKGRVVAIPEGWATDAYLQAHHPEVELLHVSTTLEALRAVQDGEADATLDSSPVLHYLRTVYFLDDIEFSQTIPELSGVGSDGLHFLVQPDTPELASILEKAMATLTEEDLENLDKKWLSLEPFEQTDDEQVLSGSLPHPEFFELIETLGAEGDLGTMTINGQEYFGYVARLRSVYGQDEFLGFLVPVSETLKPYMAQVRYSFIVTLSLLFLLIPVVWYSSVLIVRPIKALTRESIKVKERRYDEVGPVESRITEIVDLSTAMVSMSSSIQQYEQSLHDLMESFIRLIATAIDHKSPYTGGHCERVPKLAIMIAEAASNCEHGPFADFTFKTKDEWREFSVAAWLHDCGKVTTPEHVVDKATKLETIYNRIHEVRMRFEVLLRDAEIDYWRKRIESDRDEESLLEELQSKQEEIKDDFTFIAECNLGGEFMDQDKIERVHEIARKTWIRHLDNRLGLGHLEVERYSKKASDLPREEHLLSDRPEHIFERREFNSQGDSLIDFAMDTPEHHYNLGEIYNLCIKRGTLTAEERYKINEHIIATIRMLEKLPYPNNMTRIPEYAGSHHETLIGTGYPKKLKAEEISLPGRILAVSDVFEALTAKDRPYKKAKKLSEAVQILSTMVRDQHLDADVFKLFLETGLYKKYAERFLLHDQIDEVDVASYLENMS